MLTNSLMGWALFYYEGGPHARSAYFMDLDSIQTLLPPEHQAALAALGPYVNDAALSSAMAQDEVKTVEILQVSQKADVAEMRMTLQFRCAKNQVNLVPSEDWFPVPLSWVRVAARHVCDEQPWRDAIQATAHHGICDVSKMMALGLVCMGPHEPQALAALSRSALFPALDGERAP
jgi:hypothetical protein